MTVTDCHGCDDLMLTSGKQLEHPYGVRPVVGLAEDLCSTQYHSVGGDENLIRLKLSVKA